MTEDDTFKALTRHPFDDVVQNKIWANEDNETAYWVIVRAVASGASFPSENWDQYAGGWTFEDFKEECIRRIKNRKEDAQA